MKRVGVAGNRTRYQSERMLVREKVDAGQFEWYQAIVKNLLPSQAFRLRRFFCCISRKSKPVSRSAFAFAENEKKKGDKVL